MLCVQELRSVREALDASTKRTHDLEAHASDLKQKLSFNDVTIARLEESANAADKLRSELRDAENVADKWEKQHNVR